jgi:hypothetical protein
LFEKMCLTMRSPCVIQRLQGQSKTRQRFRCLFPSPQGRFCNATDAAFLQSEYIALVADPNLARASRAGERAGVTAIGLDPLARTLRHQSRRHHLTTMRPIVGPRLGSSSARRGG